MWPAWVCSDSRRLRSPAVDEPLPRASGAPGASWSIPASLDDWFRISTDLWRPCTPSRGRTSAVLAHPCRMGSLRSSASDHDLGYLDTKSLAEFGINHL